MKVKSLFCLFFLVLFFVRFTVYAESNLIMPYPCKSYILIDESSGDVLVENNSDERLAVASLTKIMIMLFIADKVEKENLDLDKEILTTSQHAKDVEGSKVYLEVGEKISLREALTFIALPSANDASIVVAEYIAGTESSFVDLMNKKAKELGMKNTHFVNVCGLHDKNHFSSARDVAIMARELLLKHGWIKKFTSTYESDITHNGAKQHNTNRLVRFYDGCTGLKTGHHDEAGYCLCASATRGSDENNDETSLISVCLGVPSSFGKVEGFKAREENCKSLLDYGFNYFKRLDNTKVDEKDFSPVEVLKGKKQYVPIGMDEKVVSRLVPKVYLSEIEKSVEIPKNVEAPIKKDQKVGCVKYVLGDKVISKHDIVAKESVDRVNFGFLFWKIVKNFFAGIN